MNRFRLAKPRLMPYIPIGTKSCATTTTTISTTITEVALRIIVFIYFHKQSS